MDLEAVDAALDRILAARMTLAEGEHSERTQMLAVVIGGMKSDLASVAMAPDPKAALIVIAHHLEARVASA